MNMLVCTCDKRGEKDLTKLREAVEVPEGFQDRPIDYLINMLWHEFSVAVTGIFTDQWFLINFESASAENEKSWIECDEIEAGLLFAYLHYDEKDPATLLWGNNERS